MNAQQAWQAALGQLQMEMPKAAFDTWVRDAEWLSFDDEDGRCLVGVHNTYARDWLESRLSSTLNRLLTGIMNRVIEVQFVVFDSGDVREDGDPEDRVEDQELEIEVDYRSLRDALVQPHQVVVIPGYFRRWVPFLEPTLASIVVAFRQVMYLSTRSKAVTDRDFSTSPQQVANWAGIGRTTLWRQMNDHRLQWFLQQVDAEKHVYKFIATMPLTPGDAELLQDWLARAGARSDPVSALKAAIEAPIDSIWPSPPPAPRQEHLDMQPRPRSVQEVVLDACGNFKAELFDRLSELADQLAVRLMPPQDLIVVTHYFLKNWVPRLGTGPAWLVTLLRDGCFIGKNEVRDTVWLSGGNAEAAQMLGLKQRGSVTVCEWLPSIADSKFERQARGPRTEDPDKVKIYEERVRRRDEKRALLGQFLQRVDHMDGNDATAWKFRVSLLEPLVPAHQEEYDLTTGMIEDFLQEDDLYILETLVADYAAKDCHYAAKDCHYAAKDCHYANETRDYANGTGDYAIETIPKDMITRLEQAITRMKLSHYANETNGCAHETTRLRVWDALNALKHFQSPILNLVKHLETNVSINSQSSKPKLVLVGEISAEWNLKTLLSTSQVNARTRKKLAEWELEPWILVSHMLYAHSREAANVSSPMAMVASNVLEDPLSGHGGYHDILAKLPPIELARLIQEAHNLALDDTTNYYHFWRSRNQAWDAVMLGTAPEMLNMLALRLGIAEVTGTTTERV
jgi:hypothetical protein